MLLTLCSASAQSTVIDPCRVQSRTIATPRTAPIQALLARHRNGRPTQSLALQLTVMVSSLPDLQIFLKVSQVVLELLHRAVEVITLAHTKKKSALVLHPGLLPLNHVAQREQGAIATGYAAVVSEIVWVCFEISARGGVAAGADLRAQDGGPGGGLGAAAAIGDFLDVAHLSRDVAVGDGLSAIRARRWLMVGMK